LFRVNHDKSKSFYGSVKIVDMIRVTLYLLAWYVEWLQVKNRKQVSGIDEDKRFPGQEGLKQSCFLREADSQMIGSRGSSSANKVDFQGSVVQLRGAEQICGLNSA
jgi:hypothetical protein